MRLWPGPSRLGRVLYEEALERVRAAVEAAERPLTLAQIEGRVGPLGHYVRSLLSDLEGRGLLSSERPPGARAGERSWRTYEPGG